LDTRRPERGGFYLQRIAAENRRHGGPLDTFPLLNKRLERLPGLVIVKEDDKEEQTGGDERGNDDDHHASGIVPGGRVRLLVPVGTRCRLLGSRRRSDLIGGVGSVVRSSVRVGDGNVGAGAELLLGTATHGLRPVLALA
jgi:hypothetical protein